MIILFSSIPTATLHRAQQTLKWIIYSLLIINWGFYIYEDWSRAIHTLHENSTILAWAGAFATSIDESAWFILLLMFELETYLIEDHDWTTWTAKIIHGVRAVCFIFLLHTVYAFTVTGIEYQPTIAVENATSLCDLVGDDVAYVYNLEYTAVTEENCGNLSDATQFYKVGVDPVVATLSGLTLERHLAWADIVEVVIWFLIFLLIELVIRLQSRGITDNYFIHWVGRYKIFFYSVLAGLAVYWASLSHWLYAWDTFLWIGGFAAIEVNINEWRDELIEEQRGPATTGDNT